MWLRRKPSPTANKDKEPSRKAHVVGLVLWGIFMTKSEPAIQKSTTASITGLAPEAELPPLCRIEHLLKVVPIGRSTVWLWARQGRFPQPLKFAGITVWRRSDVMAWLEQVGGRI